MRARSVRSLPCRAALTLAAVLAVVLGVATPTAVAAPTPAPSVPTAIVSPPLHIDFDLSGTLLVPTLGGSGQLHNGTLGVDLDLKTRDLVGTATLPAVVINGSLYGFIPTVSSMTLTQTGELVGTLQQNGDVSIQVAARLALQSMKAFGATPLVSGDCQTQAPVSLMLASSGDGTFRPLFGGQVEGSFATGQLVNCGSLTDALNGIFPGVANDMTVELSYKA